MEFNNNMTGNNMEGGQSYAFGQIHQEEYGQNSESGYNQFCMTETQVNRVNFIKGFIPVGYSLEINDI